MSKPQQPIKNGGLHSIAAILQQRKTGIGAVNNVPKPTPNHTTPSPPPTAMANGRPNYPLPKPSPPANSALQTNSSPPNTSSPLAVAKSSPPANSSPPATSTPPAVQRSQSCSSEPKSRHDESPETKTEDESASSNSQGVSFFNCLT